MTETITSVNKISIRLTDERWAHITEEHSELAEMRFEVLETVAKPNKFTQAEATSCQPSQKSKRANFSRQSTVKRKLTAL